jgi:ABC-type transport system involved in cytochrome c biogenesis ATPase subunit
MATDRQTPRIEAQHLAWSCEGVVVQRDLCFTMATGLTLVRGGEGRGKSSLLRLLARQDLPDAGELRCTAQTTLFVHPASPAFDALPAAAWLATLRPRFPAWDDVACAALTAGFALTSHIDKPMYMLSAGSRRKVGLVAAGAARADLTLLDTPYAALDVASCRVLTRLLAAAAHDTQRAWVLADYELPQGLSPDELSTLIDLGD